MRAWVQILFLFFLTSCISHGPVKEVPQRKFPGLLPITILHTNDIHGNGWAKKDKNGIEKGGYAAQAKLIDNIWREVDDQGGVTFILSGGDVNTGTPESDLLGGEPDIIAMNKIGYDAMVLGNHEFDRGIELVHKQRAMARFPFISANIYNADGSPLVSPFVILDRGIKLGILGLTTGELATVILPKTAKKLKIQNPIAAAKEQIPRMKAQGADLIIGLTHLGFVEKQNRKNLPESFIDDVKLAEAVPELSVIVGGHSDTLLQEGVTVGKTLISQAGGHGHYLGRIDLLWDNSLKKIVSKEARVIPIYPSNGIDKKIKKLMAGFKKKAGALLNEEIGKALGNFTRSRRQESSLGNAIADSLRVRAQADVVLLNSGGIRDDLREGEITRRDTLRILPFGNSLVTAMINGAQLKEAIESGLKHRFSTGSFPQVSGIQFEAKEGKVTKLLVGGKAVQSRKLYKLATSSFLISGGDKYNVLKSLSGRTDLGVKIEQVFREYIEEKKAIQPVIENRSSIALLKISRND